MTLVNSIKFSEQFNYLIIYRAGHYSSCDTSPQYKFSTALTATEWYWNWIALYGTELLRCPTKMLEYFQRSECVMYWFIFWSALENMKIFPMVDVNSIYYHNYIKYIKFIYVNHVRLAIHWRISENHLTTFWIKNTFVHPRLPFYFTPTNEDINEWRDIFINVFWAIQFSFLRFYFVYLFPHTKMY